MKLRFAQIYTILYMGMVAEERKAGTRLGKRIKRLGVHKLLVENQSVSDAANFMRGMRWREIDALCSARGYLTCNGSASSYFVYYFVCL